MGTKSDEKAAIQAIVKNAAFVDLLGAIWKAIDLGEDGTVSLWAMADLLLDAGHREAGYAILGLAETGRGGLTFITDAVDGVTVAPRRGEKLPGRALTIRATGRHYRTDDEEGAGTMPARKTRQPPPSI